MRKSARVRAALVGILWGVFVAWLGLVSVLIENENGLANEAGEKTDDPSSMVVADARRVHGMLVVGQRHGESEGAS